MRKIVATCGAMAVAMASVPAAAQDGSEVVAERTVAGAHKFLDEVFQSSGGHVSYFVGEFYPLNGYGKPLKKTDPLSVEVDIVSIDTPESCRTIFMLNPASARPWFTTRGKWSVVDSFEIDWRNVGPVGAFIVGITVPTTLSAYDNKMNIWFKSSNAELASRLGFAVAFLREQCQMKSSTGF